MDQRGIIALEVKKDDRTYSFLMPIGSPFGEAYDVAFEFLSEILKMSQKAVEQAEQKKAEAAEKEKDSE
jgi:hypothetical protein